MTGSRLVGKELEMGYTSEQRDSLSTPLCLAKKKNGTLAAPSAGQGTDHLGIGRCKYHGGRPPRTSATPRRLRRSAK